MFNPRPNIEVIPMGNGQSCYVVDDALNDPDRIVVAASAQRDLFRAAPYNAYPGLELLMPDDFSMQLDEFFSLHIRNRLGARRTQRMYSRLSIVTLRPEQLQPSQSICHRDSLHFAPNQCVAASVLYLFRDVEMGGTSFYTPIRPAQEIEQIVRDSGRMDADTFTARYGVPRGYMVQSNAYFERLLTVPAAWNRMIFYDGSMYHTGQITAPEKMIADPEKGRLTLNGFFICSKPAI